MLPDLEIMLQPASSMEGVDGLLSDGGLHGLGGLLYVIVAALLPLQWLLALRRRLPWLARLQPLGVMSLHVALVQPTARGRVGLRDGEDSQHPRIEYPDVGACPEDMTALRAGVRFALRLSEELAVRSGYPFATDTSLLLAPGVDNLRSGQRYHLQRDTTDMQGTWRPEWRFDAASDATVDEYVREHACSALHVSGTARMARSQADGVVDSELRVFGTANLRIADASVFPEIPAAHTMAPTLLVAERCARFIMEKWEEKKDV